MQIRRQGKTRILVTEEKQGGVFAAVPGKNQRPAWAFGLEGTDGRTQMFTCPVSAIPDDVWQLLSVWNTCRLMKTLPVAGGLRDQPVWVQRYFPVFDAEYRAAESKGGNQAEQAAMLAVGAMMKVMGGGGKGK